MVNFYEGRVYKFIYDFSYLFVFFNKIYNFFQKIKRKTYFLYRLGGIGGGEIVHRKIKHKMNDKIEKRESQDKIFRCYLA